MPAEKQPLDAGFFDLPERLLGELRDKGAASELARLKAAADRLAGEVDRVVVLGIGGSYMGARALFEACCHPYHNEVAPAMRRGRPRIYFEGNNVDNDALLDLVRLLGEPRRPLGHRRHQQERRHAGDGRRLSHSAARAAGVAAATTRADSRELRGAGHRHERASCASWPRRSAAARCFPMPDGVGGRFSVLSAVGLLPAAVLGLDVEKLLEGAAAMNEHFRTAPPRRERRAAITSACAT